MADKPTCPACKGKDVAVIRYQGESYYQCVTLRPHKTEPDRVAPCKYWSTKWRPQEAARGN